MGDRRRFDLFAGLIAANFPSREHVIADVAAGKGYLQAALRERGYERITSWDKRSKCAGPRRCYRYGYFDVRSAPRDYTLVVGMHPDEGTDQIIAYAAKHRVPFCVCPCCVKPSAERYWGPAKFGDWVAHLRGMAERAAFDVTVTEIRMQGRNLVLIGRPLGKGH